MSTPSTCPTVFLLAALAVLAENPARGQSAFTPGGSRREAALAPRCDRLFDAPMVQTMSNNPGAVAFADLDGDADQDMVVANIGADSVSVFRARGGGRFDPRVDYAAANDPRALDLADVTGDGHRDIVVLLRGSNAVRLLVNQGDGTFQPGSILPTGSSVNDLATGDIDGDGDVDIVTPFFVGTTGGARLLRNNGGGSWTNLVAHSATLPTAQTIELADLDGDGDLDIALASHEAAGSLHVLPNPGDGVFTAFNAFPAGDNVARIRAGDADQDGDLDLFMTHYRTAPAAGSFSVLVNSGAGSYPTRHEFPTGSEPFDIAVGDVDHDGDTDVAVSASGDDALHLHRNQGGFAFPETDTLAVPTVPWEAVITDIDLDGVRDIAVCAAGTDVVLQFMSTTPGTFPVPSGQPTTGRSRGITSGDLTGDGRPELVVSHEFQQVIDVRRNLDHGLFAPPVSYPAPTMPFRGVLSDFDLDGIQDIVSLNAQGVMTWLRNPGDGNLAPAVPIDTGNVMENFALADLDQDGDMDVAGGLLGATSVQVMWNTGGTFTVDSWPISGRPSEFAIADFDGDGRPDIAFNQWTIGPSLLRGIHVLWNLGGGVLAPPTQVTSPAASDLCRGLIAADMDRDGDVDLVVGPSPDSAATQAPYVALNHGGVFTPRFLTPAPTGLLHDMAVADCDRDGTPEVLLMGRPAFGFGLLRVYRRLGVGNFEHYATYQCGTDVADLTAADFDGDGDADVALHSRETPASIVLLQNRCR